VNDVHRLARRQDGDSVETDAEILPIRRSGESKLDRYDCYCPRS
jgi:hypothetical protein